MFNGMLGKKVGMTSVFASDGRLVPVTVVKLGPCVVTQVKTEKTDGYNALQVGFDERSLEKCNKPRAGHFAKSGSTGFNTVREFRVDDTGEFEAGQVVGLDTFAIGDKVNVSGTSKGRGFQGTIKRHGFSRGPETHGCRNHRAPGSIGCSAWPARVIKGKKMPGHMGVDRQTVKNLEVIDIRPEENIVLIKGPVPGCKTGLLEIRKVG
ncbi:MAG: 50S ribosomal protein L3 [Desulfobacteraceae bacterium]|nr:50S ribosomal protein L3 [Desulfobacteraceae bacterium]